MCKCKKCGENFETEDELKIHKNDPNLCGECCANIVNDKRGKDGIGIFIKCHFCGEENYFINCLSV